MIQLKVIKVKNIRTSPEYMEQELQKFLDNLPPVTQIISISQGGVFSGKGIMSVIIIYQI